MRTAKFAVWTIDHSTRMIGEFTNLLRELRNREATADGDHVLRSHLVAMPSVDDR